MMVVSALSAPFILPSPPVFTIPRQPSRAPYVMALAIKIISVVVFQNNILLLPSTAQSQETITQIQGLVC